MNRASYFTNNEVAEVIFHSLISELFVEDDGIRRDPMFGCIVYSAVRSLEEYLFGDSEKVFEDLVEEFTWLSSEMIFFRDIDLNTKLRSPSYAPSVEFRFTVKPPGESRSLADWLAVKSEIYTILIVKLLEMRKLSSAEIAQFFFELRGRVTVPKASCSTQEFHSLMMRCRGNIKRASCCLGQSANAIRKRLLAFLNRPEVEPGNDDKLPKDWPLRLYGIQADKRTGPQRESAAEKTIEMMLGRVKPVGTATLAGEASSSSGRRDAVVSGLKAVVKVEAGEITETSDVTPR